MSFHFSLLNIVNNKSLKITFIIFPEISPRLVGPEKNFSGLV